MLASFWIEGLKITVDKWNHCLSIQHKTSSAQGKGPEDHHWHSSGPKVCVFPTQAER